MSGDHTNGAKKLLAPGSDTHIRDAMHLVEQRHPYWHLYLSDADRVWAVTTLCEASGCGTTLDAPTPELMDREIAKWENRQERAA